MADLYVLTTTALIAAAGFLAGAIVFGIASTFIDRVERSLALAMTIGLAAAVAAGTGAWMLAIRVLPAMTWPH